MTRLLLPLPILLAACSPGLIDTSAADPKPAPRPAAVNDLPPPANARTVEEFDTSTQADREAAATVSSQGTFIGTTVASLGDPGRPGFWIEAPLITAPGKGRVVWPATGAEVELDLIPGDGGGGRLSLAALRLLGVPLTDLPTVEVYAF
ncbi:MAG: hypothetical protein QNJ35_06090 [Paracoccaceae bacterium]|nr:hypothetical protein [Paracoccaceae bacterium]